MEKINIPALEAVNLAASLPLGMYKIDVFNGSIVYNYINTATGMISYSEMVTLNYGQPGYLQDEANINELSMLIQLEILIDMHRRHVKK